MLESISLPFNIILYISIHGHAIVYCLKYSMELNEYSSSLIDCLKPTEIIALSPASGKG